MMTFGGNMCRCVACILLAVCLIGAEPAFGLVAVVDKGKQFDLECKLNGRVILNPDHEMQVEGPGSVSSWKDKVHLVVDLSEMEFCDLLGCAAHKFRPIKSINRTKIMLVDNLKEQWFISRQRWKYKMTVQDGRKVSLITGICRKERFSGFSWRGADKLTGRDRQ